MRLNNLSKLTIVYFLTHFVFAVQASAFSLGDLPSGVVTIYTETKKGSGQGTGFFVSASGQILTAYHVVVGAREITVYDQGNVEYSDVRILALKPQYDLALLEIRGKKRDIFFRQSVPDIPSPSVELKVIGSPRGLPIQIMFGKSTSTGLISSENVNSSNRTAIFNQNIDQINILPIDMTIYSGLSGAPILNEEDKLVGLLSGSYNEGRGIAWAIPAEYIEELMKAGLKPESVSPSFSWPPFLLMSTSWRSLKRSYEQAFTPKHIQKLEVLEGILARIQGVWIGDTPSTEVVYKDRIADDKCVKKSKNNHLLTIDEIDYDAPAIQGSLRLESEYKAKYYSGLMGDPEGMFSGDCAKKVTGNRRSRKAKVHIEGDFVGTVYKNRDDKIQVQVDIHECFGKKCSGHVYGKKSLGVFRVINEEVMAWEETVFRKQ